VVLDEEDRPAEIAADLVVGADGIGSAVARLAEDHRRGISDHGRLLWQLVMLEQSLRRLTAAAAPPRTEPRQNKVRLAAR